MKKQKLIFIGSYAKGTIATGGELAKNQLFVKWFDEVFDRVYAVDTNDWKHKPWLPFILLWHLITHGRDTRVIISCQRMSYPLIVFLYFFRLKKHVIYWVIGSEIMRRLENIYGVEGDNCEDVESVQTSKKIYKTKYFKYLDKIIVQSPKMVEELKKRGLNNAEFVPNSKRVFRIEKPAKQTNVFRFVFLSRVSPEKGCDYILNCMERMNCMGFKEKISMKFYGKLEEGYDKFFERVDAIENVEYKGLLDLSNLWGYKELAENDVFLFPTYFPNEGFPGALIDAMMAGLPVIASDWNYNTEVVVSNKTGVLIPTHDEEALYKEMRAFVEGKYNIEEMSMACFNEASKYDIEKVLSKNKLMELGVIEYF